MFILHTYQKKANKVFDTPIQFLIGKTVNWKKTKTNKKFENLYYQYQGRILHSYTKVLDERILLNIIKSVFYKV